MGRPSQTHDVEGEDGEQRQIVEVRHPAYLNVYISLTDVSDGTDISIQFVSLAENKPLLHTQIGIEKGDRLGTTEIIAPIPP